jgi:hypothetical protein
MVAQTHLNVTLRVYCLSCYFTQTHDTRVSDYKGTHYDFCLEEVIWNFVHIFYYMIKSNILFSANNFYTLFIVRNESTDLTKPLISKLFFFQILRTKFFS